MFWGLTFRSQNRWIDLKAACWEYRRVFWVDLGLQKRPGITKWSLWTVWRKLVSRSKGVFKNTKTANSTHEKRPPIYFKPSISPGSRREHQLISILDGLTRTFGMNFVYEEDCTILWSWLYLLSTEAFAWIFGWLIPPGLPWVFSRDGFPALSLFAIRYYVLTMKIAGNRVENPAGDLQRRIVELCKRFCDISAVPKGFCGFKKSGLTVILSKCDEILKN